MDNKSLEEKFIEWHDIQHAKTGYWPSNVEIAKWFISECNAATTIG